MKLLVGVDIGTQGTKAALFHQSGKCLSQAFVASRLHRPKPGVVEEDPELQFQSVCQAIKRCLRSARADAKNVAGIGIDGQMAGIIGVGRDGRHVTPYDSWLDTRCAPYIKIMDQKAGDEIVAKSGGPPSFNHGPKKLWWMHERKRCYRDIAAFVQPGGYAAMRLCGLSAADAFIDKTYLHFSGFADSKAVQWDVGLCQEFGFDAEKLPRIVSPETIVGEVTGAAAAACGLRGGVPVVAGCGDTAASFLSCGAVREGICVDVAGTASVFATTASTLQADRKHRMLGCGHSAVPGLWHPYAYINGGGMNLEWFRQQIANFGHNSRKGISLDDLSHLAAQVEPTGDLPIFVPHLGGRVCPGQPDLRGCWAGLTWDHGLGHLYRAVLEGVALEYALYKKGLVDLYGDLPFQELRVTGGGEKSDLWNALKADAMQIPVRRIRRSEGAPLGAALVAGYGVGIFPSLPRAASKWIALGEKTLPRKRLAPYYACRLARYEALLHCLNHLP